MRRLTIALTTAALLAACGESPDPRDPRYREVTMNERSGERARMVRTQLEGRDITDERVLSAMRAVPRHAFVPARSRGDAYEDRPLPIGHDVTISQPYIVALMTQLAEIEPGARVLEVGTGSGYQAAVLAAMGAEVSSVEIIAPLAERAEGTLSALGYEIALRAGDGYQGWPERGPFDAILITAAPPTLPDPLLQQLAVGGHLVAPVGGESQRLVVVERTETGLTRHPGIPVRFVPMTGEAQRR